MPLSNKIKRAIVGHCIIKDRLDPFKYNPNVIRETSVFHQRKDTITAIVAGNKHTFEWVKASELNHTDDNFWVITYSGNKKLVEYY